MINKPQRVVNVWHVEKYVLGIQFSDGCEFTIDLESMIRQHDDELHEPLHDVDYFKQAAVNGLTVEWPNGLDICPDGLRSWCETGRVLPETFQMDNIPASG